MKIPKNAKIKMARPSNFTIKDLSLIKVDILAEQIINALSDENKQKFIRVIKDQDTYFEDGGYEMKILELKDKNKEIEYKIMVENKYNKKEKRKNYQIYGRINTRNLIFNKDCVRIYNAPETYLRNIKVGENIEKYVDIKFLRGKKIKKILFKHSMYLEDIRLKDWADVIT